jgi:hypothetical protein
VALPSPVPLQTVQLVELVLHQLQLLQHLGSYHGNPISMATLWNSFWVKSTESALDPNQEQ